jgi:hypothetical protein
VHEGLDSPAISKRTPETIFVDRGDVCRLRSHLVALALKGISEPYLIRDRYVSMHVIRVRLIKGYDHEHRQSTSRQQRDR